MTSTKSTPRLAPEWCELVTEFGDSNIEILSGPYAGVVFRFIRLGFVPTIDDGVQIKFEYDLIHTANFDALELTSGPCNATIIEILKEYLKLGE